VTDVEDASHLGVELFEICEVGIAPIDFVARGRFEAAFAGHVAKSKSKIIVMAATPVRAQRGRSAGPAATHPARLHANEFFDGWPGQARP
jgi:hypothetical protein